MERSLRVAVSLLVVILVGCASQAINETNYNLGVQAYRAKNYKEAVAQWSKAAESGDVSAMNNLGILSLMVLGQKRISNAASAFGMRRLCGDSRNRTRKDGSRSEFLPVLDKAIECLRNVVYDRA